MRRWLLLPIVAVALLFSSTAQASQTSTVSLKISPLRYDTTLSPNEKKKGFVDITNSSAASSKVQLKVQAFRQTNDDGALEFYDNDAVRAGVLLDYSEVELGAHETLHLAFILDGSKLINGDNFAAIFATSVPDGSAAGQQAVKVGTLLIVSNGTPSSHEAKIEDSSAGLVQFGGELKTSFVVRNTAKSGEATGFSPQITVELWPYGSETVSGPLVFAGRSRVVEYNKKGSYLGLIVTKVKTGSSQQVSYSLAITGYWRILLPIIIASVGIAVWFARYVRKHPINREKDVHLHN